MTITCLIGNGFDLGLGLKTRYLDFLPWYLSRKSFKSDAVKWLCDQIENSTDGTWADAEMAFGRLPFSAAGKNVPKVIVDTMKDFQKDLATYLRTQGNRMSIPSDDYTAVRSKFLSSVIKSVFLDGGASAQTDALLSAGQGIQINFITFNYTDTLKELLGRWTLPHGAFTVDLSEKEKATVVISPICYVHGNLADHTSMFGVDNAAQITDQGAKAYCASSGWMLKPESDRLLDYGFENAARRMIAQSNRIICLGLSYGASDVRWWEFLYDTLGANPKTRLLLSPFFEENISCESSADQFAITQDVRNAFLGSIAEKRSNSVSELGGIKQIRPKIAVMKHSPHIDFDGNVGYCDPFNLKWFGKKYVKDYGK